MKEAAYKALSGTEKVTWGELTLSKEKNGRPVLKWKDDVRCHVSVSHDGEYVFAQVLAERTTSSPP